MSSRRSFTIKEKAEIISRMKNGENNASLCKEFKVPHSTISTIWKNRDVILECFASRSSKLKKNRTSAHQDVEKALLDWVKMQKNEAGIISGPILLEKANYFARQLAKEGFKCTESWVYRFRQRYDIVLGKVGGETSNALQNHCDNGLKLKLLQEAAACHASEDAAQELNGLLSFNTEIYSDAEPLINNEADVVMMNQCCFCGESENDSFDVTDKSYVESNKIKLVLNDLKIELDFNKDSTRKSICENCDTTLNEINEFVKLVKRAQDKLNNMTQVDNFRNLLETQNEGTSLTSCNPSDNDNENLASDYKDEMDPLAVTDKKSANKILSTDGITGVTNHVIDYDLTDHIKEEIVEMTDDITQNLIPQNTKITKVHPFEVNEEASTINNVCKAASRMNTVVNRRKVTEETTNESDTVSELIMTSETVGAMSKSELILLIQSVVCQMLNK